MEETKEKIACVVDTSTGEIIEELFEGDKIVHSKEPSDIIYNFNKDKSFVKLYLEVNKLRKALTPTEFTVAMSLADYICYEECILKYGGHNNGRILTIKELSELMEIPYDNLRKTFTSLKKKGVIGIHETGSKEYKGKMIKAITVNPYIYTKGNNVNKTIAALYKDSRWK